VTANTVAGSFAVTASIAGAAVTFSLTNAPGAATRFLLSGPAGVKGAKAFSITITALDAYGNIATGYRGTVQLASSDKSATLPSNYTFTASDNGVHTFTGLILRKKGLQTISVSDASNNSILGTSNINVL
jgi:hypothetical protein